MSGFFVYIAQFPWITGGHVPFSFSLGHKSSHKPIFPSIICSRELHQFPGHKPAKTSLIALPTTLTLLTPYGQNKNPLIRLLQLRVETLSASGFLYIVSLISGWMRMPIAKLFAEIVSRSGRQQPVHRRRWFGRMLRSDHRRELSQVRPIRCRHTDPACRPHAEYRYFRS